MWLQRNMTSSIILLQRYFGLWRALRLHALCWKLCFTVLLNAATYFETGGKKATSLLWWRSRWCMAVHGRCEIWECLVLIAAADIFFKLCRTSALRSQCHGPISMLKEMWNLRLFFSSHPLPHMTYLRTTILTRQSSSYMFDVCSSLMSLMNFFQNISVFLRFGLATFVTVLFLL